MPGTAKSRQIEVHPAQEHSARVERARTPRAPRSDPASGREPSKALLLLALAVVLVAGLFLRDHRELGWGLAHLMPTAGRQVLGAAILPLVLGLAAVVGERSVARGRPYPAWILGLMVGTALTWFALAPLPGRGDDGDTLRDAVPVFAYCTWGSVLLITGGASLILRPDVAPAALGGRAGRLVVMTRHVGRGPAITVSEL